jgi:hypothetical protein
MAYTLDPLGLSDEEAQRRRGAQQLALSPAAPAGGGPAVPGAAADPAAPTKQQGSGFVNLQDFLKTNKQAGQKMAAGLYGTATQDAVGTLDTALSEVGADYKGKVDAVPGVITGSNWIGHMSAGTTPDLTIPEFDTKDAAEKGAVAANEAYELLGTEAGRKAALMKANADKGYTSGNAWLDSFLAGQGAMGRGDTLKAYQGLATPKVGAATAEAAALAAPKIAAKKASEQNKHDLDRLYTQQKGLLDKAWNNVNFDLPGVTTWQGNPFNSAAGIGGEAKEGAIQRLREMLADPKFAGMRKHIQPWMLDRYLHEQGR